MSGGSVVGHGGGSGVLEGDKAIVVGAKIGIASLRGSFHLVDAIVDGAELVAEVAETAEDAGVVVLERRDAVVQIIEAPFDLLEAGSNVGGDACSSGSYNFSLPKVKRIRSDAKRFRETAGQVTQHNA